MDDATLTLLEKSAHSGFAHPVDVLRLVEEVRVLRQQLVDTRRYLVKLERALVNDPQTRLTNPDEFLQHGGVNPPSALWGEGTDPSPTIRADLRAVCEQIRRDTDGHYEPKPATTGNDAPTTKYPGAVDTFIPFENAEAAQSVVDRLKAGEILYDTRRFKMPHADYYRGLGLTPPVEPDPGPQPGPQSFPKSDGGDEPTVVGGP